LIAAWFAWRYIPRSQPAAAVPGNGGTACEPFESIPAAEQYDAPPMSIDEAGTYYATFKMQKGGEFVVQLYADKAPITVNSFIFLSCKGFFNGVTFPAPAMNL
jgi:hypothetical protein